MKILYTNFHAGAGIGGHTVYVMSLANALRSHHRIAIATPESSALFRLAQGLEGVEVFAQDFPTRVSALPAAYRNLRQIVARGQYDLLHVNGSSDHRLSMMARGFSRDPAILWTKHNDIPMKPVGALLRSKLGTDGVIAVCDYVARMLEQSPYRHNGIRVVANGIDTDHFQPAPESDVSRWRDELLGPKWRGRVVIGSNAGTDDYKGWINLVRAARLLPPELRHKLHIVIAGDPPPERDLHEVAESGLSDHFTYVGRLDDVRPLVACFDVGFVLSWRVETISFACREMMAMGKPVIVTNHAGLPENVNSGTDGWVVDKNNPESLSKLLAPILSQQVDLPSMGRRAREKSVMKFGLQEFSKKTEAVYDEILRKRRN